MGLMTILILATSTAFAAETERKVTVSGHCTRQVVADRGAITLTSEFKSKDPKTAAAEATRAYETVKSAVKRLDLPDAEMKTSEYSVNELREWEKDKSVSKGFRARMGLEVTTSDIAKLGDVIDIATREGVQDVGSLTTTLSPAKLQKEKFNCLSEAALDARAKAERLAETLGSKLEGPLEISETGEAEPIRPMLSAMALRGSSLAAPPTVEPGFQTLSTSVQVTFRLR
jgi:hypothetical protein